MSRYRVIGLAVGLATVLLPTPVFGQMMFEKVELRTNYGSAEEGDKGKLIVDAESIRFVKKNEKDEYFSIPTNSITEIFYSRVSGRRIKTAVFVSVFLLFSKGKKHYMTLSFDDGKDIVGAVEFRLDKKNYRGALRSIEQVTGINAEFDQEGVKAEEEGFAEREGVERTDREQVIEIDPVGDVGTISISTDPPGAEIEIDGMFAGMTPRSREMKAGEHEVEIAMKGYKKWKRTFVLEAGEEFPISVQMEED